MAYEGLRSRIRRANQLHELESFLDVTRLFLDAVKDASVRGKPDKKGVIAIDITAAIGEAERLGIADQMPFIGGGDYDF